MLPALVSRAHPSLLQALETATSRHLLAGDGHRAASPFGEKIERIGMPGQGVEVGVQQHTAIDGVPPHSHEPEQERPDRRTDSSHRQSGDGPLVPAVRVFELVA